MTGLLQISPGRKMEKSCLAVGYPFRPSRKHSRFPMWWKVTLESTAARPQTGWVSHTTSLKSPWKVHSQYGVRLWRKVQNTAHIAYSWAEMERLKRWCLSSFHSGSILGQRSEEPDPCTEWDWHPDLPSRWWPQTEDYLVYQRRLHRKWVKWVYFPFQTPTRFLLNNMVAMVILKQTHLKTTGRRWMATLWFSATCSRGPAPSTSVMPPTSLGT